MTPQEKQTFYENGWIVFQDIIPKEAIDSAVRAFYGGLSGVWQSAMAERRDLKNATKTATTRVRERSVDRAMRAGTEPARLNLVKPESKLMQSISEAMGQPIVQPRGAQLATIFPHTPENRINEAGYPAYDVPFYGWHGHLDGLWNGGGPVHQRIDRPMNEEELARWNRETGRNGVRREFPKSNTNITNFTALLGIPLSEQMEDGCGNLGLLTGAHHHIERFFQMQRDQGGPLGPDGPDWPRLDEKAPNRSGLRHYPDQVRDQFKEGAAYTSDGRMWPRPDLVKMKPGDAVLVLHAVPHSSSRLERLTPRINAYFRLTPKSSQRESLGPNPEALCDCWLEWEGMHQTVAANRASS